MTRVDDTARPAASGARGALGTPRDRWARWLAFAVIAVLCLGSNFQRELVQPDEGRYAEIPREMLVSGDYVVPRLNDIAYIEKPPLQYWVTSAAYAVLGISGWVSRLWNLLLGLCGLLAVYVTGRALWGRRAGEFAALVLAATPLYVLVGQLNLLDMGLTFFLTAALASFVRAQAEPEGSPGEARFMWLCWSSVGLAFLQKGLVAFAVPFITLVAYCLLQRDWRVWRRLHLLAGVLLVGVLTLPWLILLALRDGAYAQFFLIHEHFTRFLTSEHQRTEAWWFFIAVLAAGCLPWTPLVLTSTLAGVRRDAGSRFNALAALALWAVVVVVFFSLSGSKLVPYVLPCLPPMALLAGRALDRGVGKAQSAILLVTALLLVAAMLASPWVVTSLLSHNPNRPLLLIVARWAAAGGAIAGLGLLLCAWALRRRHLRVAVACLALGLHLGWMTFEGGSNTMAYIRGVPGAASRLAPEIARNAPFFCVGAYLQSLNFELGRSCRLVEYTGELEMQFDKAGDGRAASFQEFAQAWLAQGDGFALMHRETMGRMSAAGLPARVLAEYPDFVIVGHP